MRPRAAFENGPLVWPFSARCQTLSATGGGGGVWTASSLYARLEAVESRSIPTITHIEEQAITDKQELLSAIKLIEQELADNDVSQLQGKLAALGVNLQTIIEQQQKLLLFQFIEQLLICLIVPSMLQTYLH